MKNRLIVVIALLAPLVAAAATTLTSPVRAEGAVTPSALGDLSTFEKIAGDTLLLVQRNELAAAEVSITAFETAWDGAEPVLYRKNQDQWSFIDEAADAAISSLRAPAPDRGKAEVAVSRLLAALRNHPGQ